MLNSSHRKLAKCKSALLQSYHLYKRKKKKLTKEQQLELQNALLNLQTAILNNDIEKAEIAKERVHSLTKQYLHKNLFEQTRDLIGALVFALIIAVVIRQMWFEFYEIPSGSMRPTLKEKDRLTVSKTDFGINLPLTTKHLYFDSSLAQRSGIFIFTGENMDIRDVDTLYFYILPGKKQYVKRLMGKPGDTLYFYGGQMYGIDIDGNDISSQLQVPSLAKIDHIPFIYFEGKASLPQTPTGGIYSPVIIQQMNEPIARLSFAGRDKVKGEMIYSGIDNYSDLWGFKNYAMARLLTKDEMRQFTNADLNSIGDGTLYLELRHHPSLASAHLSRDEWGRVRPVLGYSTSYIPLQEEQLHAIFDNLYTARFVIQNGFASRYAMDQKPSTKTSFFPYFAGIPDGIYEFYYGKAYEVKWQGITTELPKTHPIYQFDAKRVQQWFNIGIEFYTHFAPQAKEQKLIPSRYGYFRNQDLYLMGAPILKKEDPLLITFLNREYEKQSTASAYVPFQDNGPPLRQDGSLDIDFIRTFGLKIPEKSYLALGDNYAMSADSRDFGFVPEDNVRGGPDFIFWPPGSRWGHPNQPPYPFINLPRSVVWVVFIIVIIGWRVVHRRRSQLPLKDL